MSGSHQDSTPLSPRWRQAVILVMIFGFSLLIWVTAKTYAGAPPIPARVVGESGQVLFTGEEIKDGQEVFLKYGLMEHGTLWGHGAYLGPDYTAEYLHRQAEIGRDVLAQARYGKAFKELDPAQALEIGAQLASQTKQNRYDPGTDTLRFTDLEAAAYRTQTTEWKTYFSGDKAAVGLPTKFIQDEGELRNLTAYFAWATWATVAPRPGKDYSYTNNWPYEPLVGNTPTASTYLWSAMSLIALLGGLGLILFIFGKFDYLGWGGEAGWKHAEEGRLHAWTLTPSQKAVGLFFAVVALLFLGQTALGGALAHYRVEPGGFYGFDLARILPYNLARTWHLQLAIFWIATAWVGGGLFLAPLVGGVEPKGQKAGVLLLLGALAIVVFGSLFGEFLGINGYLGSLWFWLGHQGSEYLDLGRFWQILLAVGLIFWLFLMFRALRPAMKGGEQGELPSLFFYAAIAIPLFYVPALFYGPRTNFAVIDNWRFWIIHLWVEGFFELFATVLVAVMFYQLGLVTAKSATRLVYLDAILYLAGGIMGIGHHWYFTGQGTLNMGLAASFSALEVVPLTLLTLDAWDFIRLQDKDCEDCGKPLAARQRWAIKFLIAVGVWNFVGAGVFGFLINLPIVSYFEIGTTLTANHGHAAMFGVFGMLALAVLVFCLRELKGDRAWERVEKAIRFGFWGLNIGLGLMLLLDLFPAGVLQLWDVLSNGYWHARRLSYLMGGTFHTLEWIRIVADTIFLLAGALPIAYATLKLVFTSEPQDAA
ncbi:nitric-oxide reductase large subunit [Geothrix oryzisoli]|uniref:nitric-oxide reductase large subunit n=1 Tax=Geothrix oryzisoli TaxID=2922721 RepID=UPI001FAC0C4A|nr:nitric-oxide reductase large subunit [Geothrix oryzisoli]